MPATVSSGLAPFRQVLPNGAVLIVQETAFSPAVTINLAFRAGSLDEPDDRPGLAWFLGRVIDRGTTTRSADAIAESLDDRGVALRVTTNRHVVALTCTCLSEDFDEVLAVVADVIRNPTTKSKSAAPRRLPQSARTRTTRAFAPAKSCRSFSTGRSTLMAVRPRDRSRASNA